VNNSAHSESVLFFVTSFWNRKTAHLKWRKPRKYYSVLPPTDYRD